MGRRGRRAIRRVRRGVRRGIRGVGRAGRAIGDVGGRITREAGGLTRKVGGVMEEGGKNLGKSLGSMARGDVEGAFRQAVGGETTQERQERRAKEDIKEAESKLRERERLEGEVAKSERETQGEIEADVSALAQGLDEGGIDTDEFGIVVDKDKKNALSSNKLAKVLSKKR